MNIRIFDGRYNATAPPLHLCFACAFRPAGSLKWDTCAQVWPRHNSVLLRERMLAISWLHFSFERNIVMLGNRMVFVNWSSKSVTWVWAIIVENWIVNCLLSMPGVHCMFSWWKILLEAVGILSLFKYFSAHLLHSRFTLRWKILD